MTNIDKVLNDPKLIISISNSLNQAILPPNLPCGKIVMTLPSSLDTVSFIFGAFQKIDTRWDILLTEIISRSIGYVDANTNTLHLRLNTNIDKFVINTTNTPVQLRLKEMNPTLLHRFHVPSRFIALRISQL